MAFKDINEIYEDNQKIIDYVKKQFDIGNIKCFSDNSQRAIIKSTKNSQMLVFHTGIDVYLCINEEKFGKLDELEQVELLSIHFEICSIEQRKKELIEKLKNQNK